jgi:hypothetical protein
VDVIPIRHSSKYLCHFENGRWWWYPTPTMIFISKCKTHLLFSRRALQPKEIMVRKRGSSTVPSQSIPRQAQVLQRFLDDFGGEEKIRSSGEDFLWPFYWVYCSLCRYSFGLFSELPGDAWFLFSSAFELMRKLQC